MNLYDLVKEAGVPKSLFTHATNAANLEKILAHGALQSLDNVSKRAPKALVNVEAGLTSLGQRQNLAAAEALQVMKPYKDTSSIFLTKDGYLPAYGDHVIARRMASPEQRYALNLIPGEHVTKHDIPLFDNNTIVHVPDDAVQSWAARYPKASFAPLSDLAPLKLSRMHGAAQLPTKALGAVDKSKIADKIRKYLGLTGVGAETIAGAAIGAGGMHALNEEASTADYVKALTLGGGLGTLARQARGLGGFYGNKIDLGKLNANVTDAEVKQMLGPEAMLAGSNALGVALKNQPVDIDVSVPFRSKFFYNRAVADLHKQFPNIKASPYNLGKTNKAVFTATHNGQDIDFALSHGQAGFNFRDAFSSANRHLSDQERSLIMAEKERLKQAWFLRNYRYNKYKKEIAKDLGIAQHYF